MHRGKLSTRLDHGPNRTEEEEEEATKRYNASTGSGKGRMENNLTPAAKTEAVKGMDWKGRTCNIGVCS